MKRRMTLKPVLLIELLMVALLFGIGSAFALTVNDLGANNPDPWAGQETISESANMDVTGYEFVYNAELTQVTGVNVEVTNSDAANGHTCDIDVAVGDAVVNATATGTRAMAASEVYTFNMALSANVDLANLARVNIILEES